MAHVLFVLPVLKLSGAERVVVELARRLPARGFTTSIVCLESDRTALGDKLRAEGIAVAGLKLSRRRSLACAKALEKVLPTARPLIVNSHLFHANLAARLAFARMDPPRREGVHIVSTVQVAERRLRPWQFWLDKRTAPYARAEVCVSQSVAKFQRERTGLPESFFRVIENGSDVGEFQVPSSKFQVRKVNAAVNLKLETWNLELETPHVASVGRLDPQKNFSLLLRAWPEVLAAFPNAKLSIAGDGPERSRLLRLAKSLNLKNVNLIGFVEDIPALLRTADLYVQPSAWEGLPLATVEAMAAGLPIVATDADGLMDIIAHERTGIIVPKDDPQRLAAALLDLLSDPARAQALGAAARGEALARFSVDRMADEYARLFQELIKS